MPELPELKIMSDFINNKSKYIKFIKAYHVEKGNIPIPFDYFDYQFSLESYSNGKEIQLDFYSQIGNVLRIWVFMGMSGNWKYVPTSEWSQTKFVRMRLDDESGNSLLLHGGFMGPKYSVNKPFGGTKRGPDPTKEFEKFKLNVTSNLSKKSFDSPICEVLLNQEYFNGIGNYIRSTILYYLDVNPFESARKIISENPKILDMCRDIPMISYKLNGGQLKDWKNPFDTDSKDFKEWVFYQKGISCKDKINRTFWFDPKWEVNSPYKITKRM